MPDGGRIDIFAYPLIGLVLWNLIVYAILIVRTFRSAGQSSPAADPTAARPTPATPRDGFFRRWLARLYANRVHARIDAFITHSIGFNAPLAPGLRRFAADWCEVGRPLFRERVGRLLHLAAILAAAGLMAGYDFRGWVLRQAAGWSTTVFGPASAHTALVTLYGAASAVSGVRIPSAQDLLALAWTSHTAGGGAAGQWLYLIDWTALLYIVLPRLLAAILTTLSTLAPVPDPADAAVVLGIPRRRAAPLSAAPEPPPNRAVTYRRLSLIRCALEKREAAAARIQTHPHAERQRVGCGRHDRSEIPPRTAGRLRQPARAAHRHSSNPLPSPRSP